MVRVPSNCNLTPVAGKSSPPRGALRDKTPRSKYGVLPAGVKPTNSPRVRKALGREPFDAAG